ncbi:MAG TPA: helix-turn-helix domain-containing protein [Virgibacillus sp.]|nr:helix-turn-helix domain-containing protein [Virgibacillus sp.]HLR66903.1 helix-turn-helix domain-containing protein [Virgibacillus sp.]
MNTVKRTTLNVDEVATFLGLSKHTIYHLAKTEEIPHIKIGGKGGRILFRISSIEQWLQDIEQGL